MNYKYSLIRYMNYYLLCVSLFQQLVFLLWNIYIYNHIMYTVEKNAFAVINNTPTYGLKIPLPTPNSSTVWVIGLLCQTSQNCCFGKFSFVLANSYLASNLGEEVDCAQ